MAQQLQIDLYFLPFTCIFMFLLFLIDIFDTSINLTKIIAIDIHQLIMYIYCSCDCFLVKTALNYLIFVLFVD